MHIMYPGQNQHCASRRCNFILCQVYNHLKRCIQKVSRLKLYLLKQKWTMNEILIFIKIISLEFNTFIPVSLLLVEAPLRLLFWYGSKLHCHICFNVLHVLKSYLQFKKKKKSHKLRSGEYGGCSTCIILSVFFLIVFWYPVVCISFFLSLYVYQWQFWE